MSHFTVLVKVTKEKLAENNGDIEQAVAEMLAPYQENNMGDCPKEFLAFNDKTNEVEKVANEVITAERHYGREHPETVGKTILEVFGSLESVAEDWCGYHKDEETGKYGYWENPNRKWDWYQIGGRWSGSLRVKEMADTAKRGEHSLLDGNPVDEPHTADIASVADVDFEGMDLEVDLKIEEFWDKYNKFHAGELKDDRWVEYGTNNTLTDLGLLKCTDKGVRHDNGEWARKPQFEELPFTLDDLKTKYRWHWEFGTWAVVDENGWHEKGQMGWWGMTDATPEDEKEWAKSYVDAFLKNEKQDTILAIVDCHI